MRSPLEILVAEVVCRNASQELRQALRDAMDAGATPDQIRRRFGCPPQSLSPTALVVDWLVDEWERDHGLVRPDQSIDDTTSTAAANDTIWRIS